MPTFKLELTDEAKATLAALQALPANVLTGIAHAMDRENEYTVGHIDQAYLSFPKDGPTVAIGCRVLSNRLRGSIRASKAVIAGDQVQSAIGSNVVYAAAQEFGADYPARTIVPKNAKALRFQIGQRVIFRKKVNIPAYHMEGRHFVERGIADRWDNYTAAISNEIMKGFAA